MNTMAGKTSRLSPAEHAFYKHRLKQTRRARTYIFLGTVLGAGVILVVVGSTGFPFTAHLVGALALVSFFLILFLTAAEGYLLDRLHETVERSKGPRPGGLLAVFGLVLLVGGIAASVMLPEIGFEFGDRVRAVGLQVALGMALALLGIVIAVRGFRRFLGESEAAGF